MSTDGCSEKYAKTLIGETEMKDALKRLDMLTEEEARMVAAENLKATHTVDKRVQGVADTVAVIDNRVAVVDDRVACVSDQLAGVDDRVVGVKDRVVTVDDRVKVVDNKVMEVIAGV
jgi:archaellum component FlaC